MRVTVQANYSVTNIWNVFGVIEGAEEPDKYVLIGSHRDAWTFGGGDPVRYFPLFFNFIDLVLIL